jgi:formylmethanofuran dehydrogenase subunit E
VKHEIKLQPIGHIENNFNQPAPPEEIRAVESRIVVNPELQAGLEGLEAGDQILVIFYFHLDQGFELIQHPRGDPRGVFALHSPNRPNGIGVSTVEIESIKGNVLLVSGLDALNGTPLLDIKPA